MIDKVTNEQCCLCRACSNRCPTDAIEFVSEDKGFYYPKINHEKCIGCQKCEKVCPIMNPNQRQISDEFPKVYAAKSKNEASRLQSTSGGIFYEAATTILRNGGYVCGAILKDGFRIAHTLSNDSKVVQAMRGSKYAQSDTSGVYKEIELVLRSGRPVLFFGCPCQVAGLRAYLGKEYENLFLLEPICHGVPSQVMLDSYIAQMEQRYKSKIQEIRFRDKKLGWHRSAVSINFENGKNYLEPITVDAYMGAFLSGTTLKECCYQCQFKNFSSGSDITLGDFWGAEKAIPGSDDNKGLSAVFVNSNKGQELLNMLGIEITPVDAESVINFNRNVVESTKRNALRAEFYSFAEDHGYGKAIEHYFRETRVERLRRKAKYTVHAAYNKIRGREKPLY